MTADQPVQLVEGVVRPVPWEGAAAPVLKSLLTYLDIDPLMGEAWDLTNGERASTYGRAEDVFTAYGHIWTGLLMHKLKPGESITAADVTILMTALKLGREIGGTGARDNVVDAHGYLSLLARVRGWIKSRADKRASNGADLVSTGK